jgi:hypothetical protein
MGVGIQLENGEEHELLELTQGVGHASPAV